MLLVFMLSVTLIIVGISMIVRGVKGEGRLAKRVFENFQSLFFLTTAIMSSMSLWKIYYVSSTYNRIE